MFCVYVGNPQSSGNSLRDTATQDTHTQSTNIHAVTILSSHV